MKTKLELGFMRYSADSTNEAERIVDYAIQSGNPYFETCYFYMNNSCEQFVYSILRKYNRSDYYICGKAPIHSIIEEYGIQHIFNEQLASVPGGYFDTYILQALDQTAFIILYEQGVIQYLLEQKNAGHIKELGISVQSTPEVLKRYLDIGCFECVQIPLNYFDMHCCYADQLLAVAKSYNVRIIAQAPLKGGLLPKIGISVEDSLAYIDSYNIDMILVGTTSYQHYVDITKYLDNGCIKYSSFKSNIAKLNRYLESTRIRCMHCNRCSRECKANIPLMTYVDLYNKCLDLNDTQRFAYFTALDSLKKCTGEPVNICYRCKRCESVCPSGINIEKTLNNIFEIRT